jgi:hypothetical protein
MANQRKDASHQSARLARQVGVLGGISAALAAAAAAAYFLYGSKDTQRHRVKLRGWMVKAKGEVLERLERAKEVNEAVVHQIIDQVMAKYEKVRHIGEEEARKLGEELKRKWRMAERELARTTKKVAAKRKSAGRSGKSS